MLEEGSFRGRSADFLWMLLLGMFSMIVNNQLTIYLFKIIAPFIKIMFLGSSLTGMMVYVWSRRNPVLIIILKNVIS